MLHRSELKSPTAPLRTPIGYYGAKTLIAPSIVAAFPDHTHYVEPYGGSLAVLLAKRRSPLETVNDLDESLMTFWRVLRDQPDELNRVCALTPHAREEHRVAAFEDGEFSDLEIARRVFVQLNQGRAATLRRWAGWRHHAKYDGSASSLPARLDRYLDRMPPAAARLRSVSLEFRPAFDIIEYFGQHPEVLIYADPPYLASTRSTSLHYRYEMRDEHDHRDLADLLSDCRASVVVSGYDSPLYRELYDGWYTQLIPTGTTRGGAWAARTEVLWSNRPPRQGELW